MTLLKLALLKLLEDFKIKYSNHQYGKQNQTL